jgi:Formiminotransferase domain, N-terminal subdomain
MGGGVVLQVACKTLLFKTTTVARRVVVHAIKTTTITDIPSSGTKKTRRRMSSTSTSSFQPQQPPHQQSLVSSQSLLACNVYVSAGQQTRHERILLQLLRDAQSMCAAAAAGASSSSSSSSSSDDDDDDDDESNDETRRRMLLSPVIMVHAYADPVYNRSSFHLAGTNAGNALVDVAASLAISAIQMLARNDADDEHTIKEEASDTSTSSSDCTSQNEHHHHHHHHPFVGYVDHISVMPLASPTDQNVNGSNHTVFDRDDFQPKACSASGMAARAIGKALEEAGLVDEVYYYGDAHPLGTPLATVRRERTRFFQTGGCCSKSDTTTPATSPTVAKPQVTTVGAPPEFVENFNVRLTRHVSKAMAQSLTRHVRERDGGLANVEALTLSYSRGRWEVACNLLRPITSTTARHIETVVQQWQRRQQLQTNSLRANNDDSSCDAAETPTSSPPTLLLVEQCYRVGTTTEQCLQALISCANDKVNLRKHDEIVAIKLKEFLQQS